MHAARSQQTEFAFALAVSVAAHVLILGLVFSGIVARLSSARSLVSESAPEREPEIVAVISPEMIHPPEIKPEKKQPAREYVRTSGMEVAESAAKDSAFISDRNTRAASSSPEVKPDAAPVPTMEGKQRPGLEIMDREEREGKLADDLPRPPEKKSTAMDESIPEPEPMKLPDEGARMKKQLEDVRDKASDLLAQTMLRPPRLEPVEFDPPAPRTPDETFVPQTRRVQVTGNITNKGPASVDAESTAVGRYMRQFTGAVERKWNENRQAHGDILNYSHVRVRFYVTSEGKPVRLELLEEKANPGIVDFTLGSILEAKIPPMSKEVVEELSGDPMEITYDFIID